MTPGWPEGMKVAVAMSGGVDSSVAAALLLQRGWRVVGLTMRLWEEEEASRAAQDAARVCDVLGIPHTVVDYRQPFKSTVVDYFIDTYTKGLTPNPCVICNQFIKFGHLLDYARREGASFLATGHYARIRHRDGLYRLLKGRDERKDQAYFLYRLTQAELAQALFPLGDYVKHEVRQIARELNLPAADRPESQESCFIHDNDYRRFLLQHVPGKIQPGPILDSSGRELGRHRGLPFYTIGQRSGLGISAPHPLFVLEIDVQRNALVVGPASELGRSQLTAVDVNYIAGQEPRAPLSIGARIRYQAREAAAVLTPLGKGAARVSFAAPLRDITPGQSVVFYQGDEVLGGGIISSTDHRP